MRKMYKFLIMSLRHLSLLELLVDPLFAQHGEEMHVGEKAVISLIQKTRIGNVLLEPGSYQIQHANEGETHFMAFRKMTKIGDTSSTKPGSEVARAYCRLEPLGKTAECVKLRVDTNAVGEWTIKEIQVKGENVNHVLPSPLQH